MQQPGGQGGHGEAALWDRRRPGAQGLNAAGPEKLVGRQGGDQGRNAGVQPGGGSAGTAVMHRGSAAREEPGMGNV